MSLRCLMNGMEVNYPCSPSCALFGDCVTAFEAQKKSKARTNSDRIRAMSDEELAAFICDRCNECSPKTCPGAEKCNGIDGRANGLVKWLQQPAEEDPHGK